MEKKKILKLTKEDVERLEKYDIDLSPDISTFDELVIEFFKTRSYEEWKALKQAEEEAKRRRRKFESYLNHFSKGWYELRYERGE